MLYARRYEVLATLRVLATQPVLLEAVLEVRYLTRHMLCAPAAGVRSAHGQGQSQGLRLLPHEKRREGFPEDHVLHRHGQQAGGGYIFLVRPVISLPWTRQERKNTKMKRILALTLAFVMCLVLFTGCSEVLPSLSASIAEFASDTSAAEAPAEEEPVAEPVEDGDFNAETADPTNYLDEVIPDENLQRLSSIVGPSYSADFFYASDTDLLPERYTVTLSETSTKETIIEYNSHETIEKMIGRTQNNDAIQEILFRYDDAGILVRQESETIWGGVESLTETYEYSYDSDGLRTQTVLTGMGFDQIGIYSGITTYQYNNNGVLVSTLYEGYDPDVESEISITTVYDFIDDPLFAVSCESGKYFIRLTDTNGTPLYTLSLGDNPTFEYDETGYIIQANDYTFNYFDFNAEIERDTDDTGENLELYIPLVERTFTTDYAFIHNDDAPGMLYDLDQDGIRELILLYDTSLNMDDGNKILTSVCDVYSITNGSVQVRLDQIPLEQLVVAPYSSFSVVDFDGNRFVLLFHRNSEAPNYWEYYTLYDCRTLEEVVSFYCYYEKEDFATGDWLDEPILHCQMDGEECLSSEFLEFLDALNVYDETQLVLCEQISYGEIGMPLDQLLLLLKGESDDVDDNFNTSVDSNYDGMFYNNEVNQLEISSAGENLYNINIFFYRLIGFMCEGREIDNGLVFSYDDPNYGLIRGTIIIDGDLAVLNIIESDSINLSTGEYIFYRADERLDYGQFLLSPP